MVKDSVGQYYKEYAKLFALAFRESFPSKSDLYPSRLFNLIFMSQKAAQTSWKKNKIKGFLTYSHKLELLRNKLS